MSRREFMPLFKRATRDQTSKWDDRWDVNGKMNYIAKEDLLSDMITVPLVEMMNRFGLLYVVGSIDRRVVGRCGALLSRPRRAKRRTDLALLEHCDSSRHLSPELGWG